MPQDKKVLRCDADFQLHPREEFMRQDNLSQPDHWAWLREPHNFPIYMQEDYPDVPASVRFPRDEIVAELKHDYFTSTSAYMLGLALCLGYPTVELYGIHMVQDTEYRHQRACFEFWLGVAHARGVEVKVHGPLLSGIRYAYGRSTMINRQFLELRHRWLEQKHPELVQQFSVLTGAVAAGDAAIAHMRQSGVSKANIKLAEKEQEKLEAQLQNAYEHIKKLEGSIAELNWLMDRADLVYETGASLESVSSGEIASDESLT